MKVPNRFYFYRNFLYALDTVREALTLSFLMHIYSITNNKQIILSIEDLKELISDPMEQAKAFLSFTNDNERYLTVFMDSEENCWFITLNIENIQKAIDEKYDD